MPLVAYPLDLDPVRNGPNNPQNEMMKEPSVVRKRIVARVAQDSCSPFLGGCPKDSGYYLKINK